MLELAIYKNVKMRDIEQLQEFKTVRLNTGKTQAMLTLVTVDR